MVCSFVKYSHALSVATRGIARILGKRARNSKTRPRPQILSRDCSLQMLLTYINVHDRGHKYKHYHSTTRERNDTKNSVMKNVSQLQVSGGTPSKLVNYFNDITLALAQPTLWEDDKGMAQAP